MNTVTERTLLNKIINKSESTIKACRYIRQNDGETLASIINWNDTFIRTLTEEDIKRFRSIFVSDEIILEVIFISKIFDEKKNVRVDFIKTNFSHNLDTILLCTRK